MSIFTGAPRLHGGGALGADEVPFIGKKGEVVGWPNQMRQAFGGGGTTINIIDQRSASDPDIGVSQGGGFGQEDVIDIVVPAVKAGADRGLFDETFGGNWGARRKPLPGA